MENEVYKVLISSSSASHQYIPRTWKQQRWLI